MKLYCKLLRQLKKHLSKKRWMALGDSRVNGFNGLILFFVIFAFVRIIWWGGDSNFALYTGYDGTYKPTPVMTFINLEKYNQWISEKTADGVNFFTRVAFRQETIHNNVDIFILENGKYAGGVKIFPTCAGNREMVIILLVMLLLPGPTKPRLWFIPASLIAFFIINCFRLAFVAYITKIDMNIFVQVHDYSGKAMSVFVFFIWLLWEKRYAEKYRLNAWKQVENEERD
ncbi:MAG: exosortase/archaeosortase family protein [Bacteroidales bacterium]